MMQKEEKLELYRSAVESMQNAGHEASLYEDYSGRGMYGATCPGIVTNKSGVVVGFYIAEAIADEYGPEAIYDFDESVLPQRTDSMGLDTIYY